MKNNTNRNHRIGQAADKARELFVACKIGLSVYRQHIKRLAKLQEEQQ